MTPTEILAIEIADLKAQLQIKDETIFYAVARVRELESTLHLSPTAITKP